MRIKITTVGFWDNILEKYPSLAQFNFKFDEDWNQHSWHHQPKEYGYVTINSLDDLDKLSKSVNNPLIYHPKDEFHNEPTLEIFDDYYD